jgi:hypothetical protein
MNLPNNRILQLVHSIRMDPYPSIRDWRALQARALDALKESDAMRMRIAELERELANEKRAQLYGMTDLA